MLISGIFIFKKLATMLNAVLKLPNITVTAIAFNNLLPLGFLASTDIVLFMASSRDNAVSQENLSFFILTYCRS